MLIFREHKGFALKNIPVTMVITWWNLHIGTWPVCRASLSSRLPLSEQADCWLAVRLLSAVHLAVCSGRGQTTSTLLCFKTRGVWDRSVLSVKLYLPRAEKKTVVVVQREFKRSDCTNTFTAQLEWGTNDPRLPTSWHIAKPRLRGKQRISLWYKAVLPSDKAQALDLIKRLTALPSLYSVLVWEKIEVLISILSKEPQAEE